MLHVLPIRYGTVLIVFVHQDLLLVMVNARLQVLLVTALQMLISMEYNVYVLKLDISLLTAHAIPVKLILTGMALTVYVSLDIS